MEMRKIHIEVTSTEIFGGLPSTRIESYPRKCVISVEQIHNWFLNFKEKAPPITFLGETVSITNVFTALFHKEGCGA